MKPKVTQHGLKLVTNDDANIPFGCKLAMDDGHNLTEEIWTWQY